LSRSCTVCSHPDSVLINEELVLKRTANRRVAAQYGLTEQSIRRHREHIPEMLARSSLAEEVAEADSLLERLEDLHRRTEAILARVEETDNYGASLGAIREMRRNLELIGEVTKELDRTPTINLHLNPQWLELRAVIVTALEPYTDARESVLRAIEGASNGSA
jgi:hypothetical protein